MSLRTQLFVFDACETMPPPLPRPALFRLSGILDIDDGAIFYHCFSDRSVTVRFTFASEAPREDMDEEEQDDAHPNGRVPDFSAIVARCIDILASMGTGKTYGAERFFYVHPDATILIICPRKSMCFAMTKRLEKLGFQLYTPTMDARRLVVEYESIHKLQRTYDLVYMDEIRSVLSTAVCYATNRLNATRHLDRLVELCTKAKHTILTDADYNLDCAVDLFRDTVFEPKDAKTIRVPKLFMERKFTFTSKVAAFKEMYADLRDGHRVVACFASAKLLRVCMEHLKTFMNDILITGYFAAADNKDELFDVNQFWGTYQFIGYTSTVTVSLDFTEPVYRVYVFPNKHAACSREALQGSGRSRYVTTGQVIVAMDSSCRYMPLERGYDFKADYERDLKFLTDRRAAVVSFNSLTARERELYGTFTGALTEEGRTYTPTLYTKLWAVDRAEQALKLRAWYPHLMWMLEKKGSKVEYADEEETADEPGSGMGGDIVQGVSIAADAIVAQEIEDMDDIDATELDDDWQDEMDKNTRDRLLRGEKLALRKYHAQKYFTPALTGVDVAFFEKHKKAILYRMLERDATSAELFAKNKEAPLDPVCWHVYPFDLFCWRRRHLTPSTPNIPRRLSSPGSRNMPSSQKNNWKLKRTRTFPRRHQARDTHRSPRASVYCHPDHLHYSSDAFKC